MWAQPSAADFVLSSWLQVQGVAQALHSASHDGHAITAFLEDDDLEDEADDDETDNSTDDVDDGEEEHSCHDEAAMPRKIPAKDLKDQLSSCTEGCCWSSSATLTGNSAACVQTMTYLTKCSVF